MRRRRNKGTTETTSKRHVQHTERKKPVKYAYEDVVEETQPMKSKIQPKVDEQYIKSDNLNEFRKHIKDGSLTPDHKYIYVIIPEFYTESEEEEIRYFDQTARPGGHSGILSEKQRKQLKGDDVSFSVIYAGQFNTDLRGRVKDFDNDSGHFKPDKKYVYAIGLHWFPGITPNEKHLKAWKEYNNAQSRQLNEYSSYFNRYRCQSNNHDRNVVDDYVVEIDDMQSNRYYMDIIICAIAILMIAVSYFIIGLFVVVYFILTIKNTVINKFVCGVLSVK